MMQVKIFKSEVSSVSSLEERVNEFLYKNEFSYVNVTTKIVQGFRSSEYGHSSAYVIIVVEYKV